MKFSIKVSDLLAAVEKVSSTVDKKGFEEGTSSILVKVVKTDTISAAYFYSTMHTAETVAKFETSVEVPGIALFQLNQLKAGLLYRNPEHMAQIELEAETPESAAKVGIKIGRSVFHVQVNSIGQDAMVRLMDDIPFRKEESFTMLGKSLAEFVRRASYCIPRENEGTQRFELSGMRLITTERGYEAHATDGHICARIIIKGQEGIAPVPAVLIPNAALLPLSRLVKKEETVKIIEGIRNDRNDLTKLFFKIGTNTFFGTRLLTGMFPVIDSVIEMHKPDFWFKVDREVLKETLERAVGFDDLRLLKIRILGKEMQISSKGKIADNFDPIEIELEEGVPDTLDLTMTINIDYLKNVAAGSTLAKLRLGVSDMRVKAKVGRALIVDDADEQVSAVYAIMPVKQ
jgi:DNA polymerase III sliding clamp (beta) subunit (PCNA family)